MTTKKTSRPKAKKTTAKRTTVKRTTAKRSAAGRLSLRMSKEAATLVAHDLGVIMGVASHDGTAAATAAAVNDSKSRLRSLMAALRSAT